MSESPEARPVPSRGFRWRRALLIAVGIAGLYVLGRLAAEMIAREFALHISVSSEPMIHGMIMTAWAAYVILMSVPFMPGMEIGLSMILVLGPNISFLVYAGTVLALVLAYAAGRLVPMKYCSAIFGFLGLARARRLVDRVAPLPREERLAFLIENAPPGVVPFLIRHRFVALAVLLNLPGNMVIGGGGGIAMAAGITGLFPFPAYLLTIALAVAPVPLLIYLTEIGM